MRDRRGEASSQTHTAGRYVAGPVPHTHSAAGLTGAQFVLLTPLSLLIALDQPVPASSAAMGHPEALTSLLPVPQDHFSPGSSGLKRHLVFVFPWQQTQLKVFSLGPLYRCYSNVGRSLSPPTSHAPSHLSGHTPSFTRTAGKLA